MYAEVYENVDDLLATVDEMPRVEKGDRVKLYGKGWRVVDAEVDLDDDRLRVWIEPVL